MFWKLDKKKEKNLNESTKGGKYFLSLLYSDGEEIITIIRLIYFSMIHCLKM